MLYRMNEVTRPLLEAADEIAAATWDLMSVETIWGTMEAPAAEQSNVATKPWELVTVLVESPGDYDALRAAVREAKGSVEVDRRAPKPR